MFMRGSVLMRGQGAAEYLVLLAIVIIVALIAITLLGGFTATSGGAMDNEAKSYWSIASPFGISQWVQINDTLYMSVVNRGPAQLVMRKVKVGSAIADLGAGWSWKSGGEKNISVGNLTNCTKGMNDAYSYNVTFTYDTFELPGQSQTGSRPVAGSCSFP